MSASSPAVSPDGMEIRPSPLRPLRPEDVLMDTRPRRGFVVPGSANHCDLDFTSFRVWDEANPSHVLFEYSRPSSQVLPPPRERPNNARVIRYVFDESFFKTTRLACRFVLFYFFSFFLFLFHFFFFVCFVFRTTFDVGTLGAKEITKLPPLRMIERHYLEDTLLRSFDFTYGPIELPSLRNCWEFTYDMPPLNGEQGLS